MLKGDTDTDTDTLISEISIPIPILILFKYRISILIRYRYDTFGQKYRNFDTDTIVSKVSAVRYSNSLNSIIGELFSLWENSNTSELKKKLKTQEKNSKLKGKTQFFGIFICWRCGKDGQTISLL